MAGIIAIARAMQRVDPTNARAAAVVAWADGLGHPPTGAEFMAWYAAHGGVGVDVTDESEEWAN